MHNFVLIYKLHIMKKATILALFAFISLSIHSQEIKENKDFSITEINKLTIEVSTGHSKGLKPYSPGYYSSSDKFMGNITINSFNIGARYMLSPIFGVRADLGYMNLKNDKKSNSLNYQMQVPTLGVQGVINASRLFNIENSIGRFGLLLHGGLQISKLYSRTADEMSPIDPSILVRSHNYGAKENNIGLIFGISPQYRLNDKFALITDVSFVNSLRQHFAWDGGYTTEENNLTGKLVSISIGVTYSIGNQNTHGDWTEVRYDKAKRINELTDRLNTVENLMDDTASRIINDSYISVDFEAGKVFPLITSNKNIEFIKKYLNENPTVSINIIGHADSSGYNANNNSMAKVRAEAVKTILLNSGIKANRLNIKSPEIFSTEEDNNKSLQKVIFKIN